MRGIVEGNGQQRVHIEAVDLHTGSRLRFDLTPKFMRTYLGQQACGNTLRDFLGIYKAMWIRASE